MSGNPNNTDSRRQAPPRGRPSSLTVDRVVDAAVACIARSHLDALTIRAVAAELGTSPMGLYRYVVDRDELVDRAVDRILGEVELPPHPRRAADRRAWLTAMAAEVRSVLVAHPGAAERLIVMGPTGERGFAAMDRICHVLADTGRSPEEVAATYTWLMVTVAAFAARHTRATSLAETAGVERPALRDLFGERVAPFATRFPHVAAIAGHFETDGDRSAAAAVAHVIDEILRPRRRGGRDAT
ncbi:MAG: TetR/AcrR family transcriptional regulator [Ilumatobacteraceae bacterium]